jgi:hypothetical protein
MIQPDAEGAHPESHTDRLLVPGLGLEPRRPFGQGILSTELTGSKSGILSHFLNSLPFFYSE